MKMKLKYIIGIALVTLAIQSCQKDLDINTDPNYPADVNADSYFSSGVVFITSAVGGDLQLLGGMWAQHYAQNASSNQYTNIDSYNIPNSSTYITRSWSLIYAGALPDFQLALDKAKAKNYWHYWMASKIMSVYCFHVLTEAYGNVPFSEALQFSQFKTPQFDDAKTINSKLIVLLDSALAVLPQARDAQDLKPMGKNDFLFNGDMDSWSSFAKSLKLKILMRDPNFSANASSIQALLDDDDFLTIDAKFVSFENKENISNPLYENDRRKLNTTENIRASSTLSRYLHANNDPRAAVFMEKAVAPTATLGNYDYVGLPQGGYTLGSAYNKRTSKALIKATDPVYFMSLAEVEFLKAEAYVRLADPASAKTAYDNGVIAAFERWRGAKDADDIEFIFPDVDNVDNFIGAGRPYEFNQTSTTTMLESIWRQKWIAAARAQGWEAFLEINRTGFPKYGTVDSRSSSYVVGNLAPSINTVLAAGVFPKRLIYPKTSADYNPNTPVSKIQDVMWWHKQ